MNFAEWCSYSCDLNDINIYINECRKLYSHEYVRKIVIDIRRLMKAINAPFADKLRLPRVPKRRKRVFKKAHIQQLIKQIEQLKCKSLRLRTKAAVLLAATSGLRSSEIYQLTLSDIDLENRIVLVNFGKTAGTSKTIKDFEERFSFFSIEARTAIEEYIDNCKSSTPSTPSTPRLFPESSIRRAFKQLNTDLRLKHMRKFFSQQSDRLGMPTAAKKILMGHSLHGDVDLQHYDYQDEEELKQIYDRYWRDFKILDQAHSLKAVRL